jgi:protein involved in polysaccharide export with SLBB domain
LRSTAFPFYSTLVLFLGFLFTTQPLNAQSLDSPSLNSPSLNSQEGTAPLPEERFVAGEAMTVDVVLDTVAFLNGGYPIDSSGYVDMPLLGKIMVGGKTREEVENYLSSKLANYLRDTHIQAVPAIRITWLGHWVKAGQYYVSPKSTVWDAVYMAGGIAGERNIDKLEVQRGTQKILLNVLDAYSKGTTLAGAGIQSGDIVIIPVPRPDEGFWYWFKESLTLTTQVATVVTSAMTAYILYLNVEKK